MKKLPERSSGILLPLFSLPDYLSAAYDFADFLADCGQHFWQVLPLCTRDEARSPYRSAQPEAVAQEYRRVLTPRMGAGEGSMLSLWQALRSYCNERGVQIIGDMPFYVSPEYAKGQEELFDFTRTAGVPADAFSSSGQNWGMPVYNWQRHRENDYAWWRARIRAAAELFDVLRIDHFRAIYDYYSFPAAKGEGEWRRGERDGLLKAIIESADDMPLIAENLGDIGIECRKWIDSSNVPGMCVLTQAFDEKNSPFLPHNCAENRVLYTSTHDTDTFVGFLNSVGAETRDYACDYLRLRLEEGLGWGAVRACFASRARLVIAPLQDVLGLGSDSRINVPGVTGENNWSWRVSVQALNPTVSGMLRHITQLYGRI